MHKVKMNDDGTYDVWCTISDSYLMAGVTQEEYLEYLISISVSEIVRSTSAAFNDTASRQYLEMRKERNFRMPYKYELVKRYREYNCDVTREDGTIGVVLSLITREY